MLQADNATLQYFLLSRSSSLCSPPFAARSNPSLLHDPHQRPHADSSAALQSDTPQPWPIICYYDLRTRPITRESCAPLINYLVNSRDFRLPKLWIPGPREPEWQLQGCRLRIISGKSDSRFSMQDVAVEMERVLMTCQPPTYLGIGGSAPVDGKEGFMYAAFHAQVTGLRESRRISKETR